MAIQIDLLYTMEVFEKYYTAEERWEKLKQLLQDQKAAQQSVQRMGGDSGENRTGSDPAHR